MNAETDMDPRQEGEMVAVTAHTATGVGKGRTGPREGILD